MGLVEIAEFDCHLYQCHFSFLSHTYRNKLNRTRFQEANAVNAGHIEDWKGIEVKKTKRYILGKIRQNRCQAVNCYYQFLCFLGNRRHLCFLVAICSMLGHKSPINDYIVLLLCPSMGSHFGSPLAHLWLTLWLVSFRLII